MKTATATRLLIIHRRPSASQAGRLSIISGTRTEYLWRSRPSGDGVTYELSNLEEPESRCYTVEITQHGNSCGCPGFQFRGSCRHVLALASLTARDAASAQMPSEAPPCMVCKGTGFKRFETESSRGLSRCLSCDDGAF